MNKNFLFMVAVLLCSLLMSNAQETITIEELFELADKNAKELKPYTTSVLQSEENVKHQRNTCLPDINVGISASYIGNGYLIERNFSDATKAPMPHFGNNASVELTQVLYAGGALKAANEIAKLEVENAKLGLENTRQNLRFRLVGYYLDLFKLQNVLQVYNENIKQTEYVLENMRAKDSEGIVLNNDVTRYELLLSELQLGRTKIKNTISILNFDLTTMLGMDNNMEILPDSNLLQTILPKNGSDFWTSQSENNYELQQLETGIKISEQTTKTNNAKRIPSIVFRAADSFDGPITIEVPPINKNFNYWYVGIGLQYNFGELYKSKHSVKKSKLATQNLQDQYANAKEQTELALHSNYVKYIESYEEMQTQEKSVELANENYEIIKNRYQNDLALITEMLDASNQKLSAEVQLINARINILFNYFKLKFISGTL